MFSFHGGQTVEKGTYWNLSSGESIGVNKNKVLPGDKNARYLKIPAAGMFIMGPFVGLIFICVVPLLFLLVTFTLLPRTVLASDALASDEAKMCLGCHATPGMVMTFKDNSTLSVHIAESLFKNTVHGFLTCTSCHSDISPDKHPSAQYASKREFALHVSSACRTCHADDQVLANPLHQRAITKANAPPCADCHGSHSISRVPTQKEKLSATQYCLTCHKQQLSTSINGETLSLSVDEAGLRKSVHGNHGCSDCHVSYSKKEHPHPKFSSKRDLSIAVSGVCRRCHPDKETQLKGSIHFNMLTQGIRKAPVCTDCHGAHAVGPKALAETMSGVPCRKCHESIFEAYKGSVHGRAKIDGNESAPLCSSCHFAHEVKPALASRSPKEVCLGCHEKVADAHSEWLPNVEMHFEAVACPVCHVPDANRSVYVRITDGTSGEIISDAKVRESLGTSYDELTHSKKRGIEGKQLWKIYQKLNEKEMKVNLEGTIGLQDSKYAHHLALKSKAIRECDSCHTADSKFFKTVSMAVVKSDGREELYSVNPSVLSSTFAMLPLNQFYVLGSTRLKVLDILGVIMVIGGMSVPIAHGTLRILTSRLRKARQLK